MTDNFRSNNYIECKSKDHRNILWMEEYRSNIKISYRWKIQLTTTINLVSSKDDNNEKREMHEKHDNIKIMMNYEADEVLVELF